MMESASALRAQWSTCSRRRAHAAGDADAAGRTLWGKAAGQRRRHDWSYAEARDAAARFAGTLRAAGIRPGDRVAIICSNRIEFLEVMLGCAWLGAVAVPINVASRGPQLQHILSNCGARLLVIEAAHADNLAMLDADALAVEAIWMIGGACRLTLGKRGRVRCRAVARRIAAAPVEPGDLGLILYTSGTTGPSKGVCCPHAQYFWWARQHRRRCCKSATATCSAPACRCSTPTRSTPSTRRC